MGILLLGLFLVACLCGQACLRLVSPAIRRIVRGTATEWDDYLLDDKVLRAACRVVPGIVFYLLMPLCLGAEDMSLHPVLYVLLERGTRIYITITFITLVTRFLTQVVEAADNHGKIKEHHIIGVVQFLKLVIYSIGAIIIIAFLLGRNPVTLIAGLGAAATVLMLVFRDSLLGLVAGIQLSVNQMLKPGDWVTIEKLGINGIVEKVTLTTVKIRNFDHTISTVPPYTLVSESFQNWEGMYRKGRRRVKRAIYIDISSVRFCTDAEIRNLEQLGLSSGNAGGDREKPVNLKLFRLYAERYLGGLPEVVREGENAEAEGNTFGWVMARQLEPTPNGLPLELWFYFSETEFSRYESLAADCMEHLIAMLPAFGLRPFQSPTGYDLFALRA